MLKGVKALEKVFTEGRVAPAAGGAQEFAFHTKGKGMKVASDSLRPHGL